MLRSDDEDVQSDGSLRFTIVLPAPVAKRFTDAMIADERESKSEFARILIKRQLQLIEEKKILEELRKRREAEEGIAHFPGNPAAQKRTDQTPGHLL